MKTFTIRLKGGPGSGFHGHKGRPGERGGSLPRGESAMMNPEGNTLPTSLTPEMMPKPAAPAPNYPDMKYLDADGNITPEGRKALGIRERNPDPKAGLRIGTKKYYDFVKAEIQKHNDAIDAGIAKGYRNRGRGYDPISFNSYEEADLWLQEYIGQISDGKYENTERTNWQTCFDLKVTVDPSKPTTFPNFRHVNMSFRDLKWLFDEEHASHYEGNDTDVRSTFSWVSDKKMTDYARSIGDALNKYNKEEYEYYHSR